MEDQDQFVDEEKNPSSVDVLSLVSREQGLAGRDYVAFKLGDPRLDCDRCGVKRQTVRGYLSAKGEHKYVKGFYSDLAFGICVECLKAALALTNPSTQPTASASALAQTSPADSPASPPKTPFALPLTSRKSDNGEFYVLDSRNRTVARFSLQKDAEWFVEATQDMD